MAWKLLHYKYNEGYEDCYNIASNISWSESLSSFGQSLSFDILQYNKQKYINAMAVDTGDIFVLKENDTEIVRAVCTRTDEDNGIVNVSCKDFAHYINKNEICVQINKSKADEAIKNICSKIGVTVGEICSMNNIVDEIMINSANTVIDNIIANQRAIDGKMRLKEMRGGKLYIIEYPTEPIGAIFKPAVNVAGYNPFEHHSKMKKSVSMENRYTAVRAYTKKEDRVSKVYTASDKQSMAKKGMLIKNLEVSNADSSNITNIAKQELSILDRDDITYSVTINGCSNVRAGRVIHVIDKSYDVDNLFRVESVTHSLNQGVYTMDTTISPLENENFHREYSDYKTGDNDSGGSSADDDYSKLYSEAKKHIGAPYVWGGSSPSGFDCSGFVWYVFSKTIKPSLKRTTAQGYYDMCGAVTRAQPGDLCFYTGTYDTDRYITHVGIYIGNGNMIAAEGSQVQISTVKRKGFVRYGRLN